MDSVSQAALGAAVGEAILGKTIGNKAPLIGAIAATIPDLDVLVTGFFGPIEQLTLHRGLSHSFLFAAMFSPLFAILVLRIGRLHGPTLLQWTWLTFCCIVTHVLLDCFTAYGTGVFEPFSHTRVAFNSIFIIDPLYTIPLVIGLVVAMCTRATNRRRQRWNMGGLILSTLYLLAGLGIKQHVNSVFTTSLERQNLTFQQYISAPTPFNTLLWTVTAADENGYWVGYYSLLDSSTDIDFVFVERGDALMQPYKQTEAFRQLQWFAKDYLIARQSESGILVSDIRFGSIGGWEEDVEGMHVFSFKLSTDQADNKIKVERIEAKLESNRSSFSTLWKRILGE